MPEPDNFSAKLFHSQSPRNYMGYANPDVDNLLARRGPSAMGHGGSSSIGGPSR